MSKQAFDNLTAQLSETERTKIYAMAAAYGLSFDDPSWVPFALTQVTLDELKAQVQLAAAALEEAADNALRKVNDDVHVTSEQARQVIEAQSKALGEVRQAILGVEKQAIARYQATLAELSSGHVKTLVETSANGIVQNVAERLTGEDAMLAKSAHVHARALEHSRQRFGQAIDTTIGQIATTARSAVDTARRGVGHATGVAAGAALLSAIVAVGVICLAGRHEAASAADVIRAYTAQRDDLLKQIAGARQLLANERTGNLSLRQAGNDWYLLSPDGLGDPQRCDDSGPLSWFQPGGMPCVPVGRAQ